MINTKSPVGDVQRVLAETTKLEKWIETKWWKDFLKQRTAFLDKLQIPQSISETEKEKIRGRIRDWISSSDRQMHDSYFAKYSGSSSMDAEEGYRQWARNSETWWAYGGWVADEELLDWMIIRYIRGRRRPPSDEQPADGAAPNQL